MKEPGFHSAKFTGYAFLIGGFMGEETGSRSKFHSTTFYELYL